jgi:hypothetical protein
VKKKSASESAFFNLRVLIGLFLVLAGIFLALLGFGTFSAQAQQKYNADARSIDPLVPPMFDCSKIHELGIDKQMNFRAGAIMIACGKAQGGSASPIGASSRAVKKLLSPLAYGGTDVDLVTGTETYPDITQSETFIANNPDNPFQIVVAYNDSRGRFAIPINTSGVSVSTDGGNTFARLTLANGQSPFANSLGDPVILYNRPTGTWYGAWLDQGCGTSLGVGGYKSTTPWDPSPTSWTHYCIHNGGPHGNDDHPSGWADNNPSSPFYGRMYISWNDFAVGTTLGAIFVRYSTDNGATWTNERQITTTFYRNVQITGDLATGDVYIAAMDEMGGGLTDRANLFYRSTDGGNTWANIYTGPAFPAPGRTTCGYFACMYPDGGGYWRHMGFGEPAALNGVVHYVYASRNTGNGDPGNVFYIRSTDRGVTFSAPLQLNTDATTRGQWEPNLSVSQTGSLFAVWYDERETASCTKGDPSVPCYRMWARRSTDNGATWLPDDAFSDVVSPLPAQPDPGVVGDYVGDYDYASSSPYQHLSAWVDGRVPINGISQQDAFHDRQSLGLHVTGTDPCVGCVVFTQPTDFIVNVSDPVNPSTVHANALTVNGTPANAFTLGQNNTQITFHFITTPVQNQGVQTMHIPAGAFTDGTPVLGFNGTFRYDQVLLQVTTTVPPVGGTFTGPGTRTYDVNWNEPVDPASVQDSDLMLNSGVPATVTGHSLINGNRTIEFTLNFTSIFSGTLTASIAAGAITDQFGNPCAAFSGNYQYVGSFCDSGIIQNEGFETGSFPPWVIDGTQLPPVITNAQVHSGTFSAFAGSTGSPNGGCANGPEPHGDSSFYQQFTVPAGGGTLSFWHWDCSADAIAFDWQDAYITDSGGSVLQTIFHQCNNTQTWLNTTVNMAPYAGQTVRIKFLVHQDGFGDLTAMYVDDVALYGPCAPMAQDAFSRKTHGAAGTFDVPLPLTGNVGIECRSGGATNDYQMIINFANPVTVGSASVTSGTGSVSSFSVSGSQVTVNLTGVTNIQRITVTLFNVNDGTHMGNVPVSMGVLVGDVNGNAVVNASDVSLTKSQVGNPVSGSNFREDVSANGLINSVDVAQVKADVGTALPP